MLKAFALLATMGSLAPLVSEDQSFFAILVETKVGRMAGMPPIDLGQLPPGIKLPREAMIFSGKPTRLLDMRLWSPMWMCSAPKMRASSSISTPSPSEAKPLDSSSSCVSHMIGA